MKKNRNTAQPEVKKPWSGRVHEEECTRPGGLLTGALVACAAERQETLNEMAAHVGVGYGYINQLRSGLRNVSSISDKFSQDCATYLGISRLQVLMLAGRISPSDFYDSASSYKEEVARALNFICEDPQWGHLITGELRSSHSDTQYAVVKLYEAATGSTLVRGHANSKNVVEDLASFAREVTMSAPMSAAMPAAWLNLCA
ncbi:DNA-binding protein [Ramlibacter sp. RBP-2]|uniref:DNA-binding protein n=1 Tax=Ramlibacter lithotrophicus TaxID=2606681 RepID=A0A7X6DK48_9BURK|nr:DNA-binding protein [Ramlibacter lithotrophicus]NKE68645.1 DNA-binding protein [Ramlibacter lithotrophicus]